MTVLKTYFLYLLNQEFMSFMIDNYSAVYIYYASMRRNLIILFSFLAALSGNRTYVVGQNGACGAH